MSDFDREVNPDGELCAACGKPAKGYAFIDDKRYCHGDEPGETCYEAGNIGLTAADAVDLGLAGKLPGWTVEHLGDWPCAGAEPLNRHADWPMPKPPPYEADDEGRAEPGAEDE